MRETVVSQRFNLYFLFLAYFHLFLLLNGLLSETVKALVQYGCISLLLSDIFDNSIVLVSTDSRIWRVITRPRRIAKISPKSHA